MRRTERKDGDTRSLYLSDIRDYALLFFPFFSPAPLLRSRTQRRQKGQSSFNGHFRMDAIQQKGRLNYAWYCSVALWAPRCSSVRLFNVGLENVKESGVEKGPFFCSVLSERHIRGTNRKRGSWSGRVEKEGNVRLDTREAEKFQWNWTTIQRIFCMFTPRSQLGEKGRKQICLMKTCEGEMEELGWANITLYGALSSKIWQTWSLIARY